MGFSPCTAQKGELFREESRGKIMVDKQVCSLVEMETNEAGTEITKKYKLQC
jgi:hypothetical protein